MISFSSEYRVLITGASSGIGRSISLLLNSIGATVIVSGRDEGRLRELVQKCHAPERCHIAIRDLIVDMEQLPRWIGSLGGQYGKLSGLVCSAGETLTQPARAYDLKDAHKFYDLCCHAPMLLARGFANKKNTLVSNASGVFISAASSIEPNPGMAIYAGAKAALAVSVRTLAKESARIGIRFNCISPGLVKTPMVEGVVRVLGEEFFEREKALYPLGIGEPEDVAHLAAFLLSDKARWITGINIPIAGGR